MGRREGPSGDERAQGKLRSLEKLAEEQRKADTGFVMSSPSGRRFMYDLVFGKCNLMGTYPGSDSGIYRHEGRRQLGVEIALELQEQHTDMYVLMITERLSQQKTDKATRDAATLEKIDE
jgi:hypothetical protein